MIEVKCMEEKKFTSAKDDISGPCIVNWNEHLFFEPKNVEPTTIEQSKISIRVLDKGYFKDAVIGCYDFDITYIYFMKDHSLMHKWLALSNPHSEVFNEVAGYLKISITIAATGDEQIQITEDDSVDKTEEAILMPPSIRPDYYQLKFRFFRAEKLPAMDLNLNILSSKGGKIDAFVQTIFMSKKLKTAVKIQQEGSFVDWDEEFLIPCQLPIMSSRIILKVYDYDLSGDELVGSLLFNLKECIEQKNGKFFWKNVYGAPLGCHGDNTKKMNETPEVASTWKGRILMQITAEKTDKPQIICQKIKEEVKEEAAQYLQEREYDIIAEVGQGIALPEDEKYSVMIKIGDIELTTEKASIQEGCYNRWSKRFKQQTVKMPYIDEFDIGRVFVYLMDGKNAVCFYSAPVEEFLDPDPEMKWIQLRPDLAIGKVEEPHKAGLLSIKLSIHNTAAKGPIKFDQFKAWKTAPPKRLNVFKIRAYLYQCRDLPAADDDGQSDPYVVIWDQSKEVKKTTIIEDNVNPIFYQTLELSVESFNVETLPPFVLDIYDYDMSPLGDDFLCRCVIPLKEASYSIDDPNILKEMHKDNADLLKTMTTNLKDQKVQVIPTPKWHGCKLKQDAPDCGQILVSFSVVADDFNYAVPLEYVSLRDEVGFEEFNVSLNILGLRNLQSVGILPVKKAFIVFNIKSLVPPNEGNALENVKTQPSDAGANPTINTLLEFKVGLPTQALYCPRLTCSVHDYIFKGLGQPLIGTFIIPVGDLVHKLKKEREEETGSIEYILEQLKLIEQEEGIASYNIQEEIKEEDLNQVRQSEKSKNSALKDLIMQNKQSESAAPLLFQQQVSPGARGMTERRSPINDPHTPKTPSRMVLNTSNMSGLGAKTPKSKLVAALQAKKDDKFNSGMKNQLLSQYKEEAERIKRELVDQRIKEAIELKKQGTGKEAAKNLLMPTYEFDERLSVFREKNIPPSSIFIPLGWNENPEQKKKHYRRYYPDELENIKEVMPVPTPFHTYDIKRGQSRGNSKGIFSLFSSKKEDESGAVTTEQVVGTFKGIVTVQCDDDRKEYDDKKKDLIHALKVQLNKLSVKKTGKPLQFKLESLDTMEGRNKFELQIEPLGINHLQITKHLADLESDEMLKRMMLSETKCIVRLYVISAYDLASRDNGGFSDPYLVVNLGNKTYNERQNYLLDEPNPQFNKHYDFESVFPGCPPLVIKVMDYDDIFGDDAIGTTSIDLEDRFFSVEWQSIKQKPVEYRQIYHQSSSVSQGVVKMWVEIHPTTLPPEALPQIYDITPQPDEEFEVRVAILDTLEVACMDVEGTSDVYIRAFFDSKAEVRETDTHFRCQDGKASFNYRLLYHLKISDTDPKKNFYTLTVQAYDRDFFKSNDIIGTATINLEDAIEDCRLSKRGLPVNKKYYNDYMKEKGIKLTYKDDNTFYVEIEGMKDGKKEITGKIRMQIDVLPISEADKNKVGEARQEPNHSPFLPPPVGRISFSFNPLKMFNQLVGPAMRRKIYCICCLLVCAVLIVSLLPLIIGDLISFGITSAFN